MIKRRKRATRTKKKVAKKKIATKIAKAFTNKRPVDPNIKARLKAYKNLESKINEAWTKLKRDAKRKNARAVLAGRENLKLLLGECNYMANECRRCMTPTKATRRTRRR